MDNIVEQVEGGICIALNNLGEQLTVSRGQSVVFDDFEGSKLKLIAHSDGVICETELPEERTSFTCNLKIAPTATRSNMHGSKNLEGLINNLRVALNGRL